ncbi:MAG: nitroreductase family protein [Caldilinea sp.]|nr:nitroreductase family protein [Caldilinea sp.]MDW8442552.1 nitroreductase family protein [Caldilineaceae bacterium]
MGTMTAPSGEVKLASTDFPVHPLIRRRWSPRAFADRPVEPEKLLSLLEAARWAPSSGNGQPWHFLLGVRGTAAHAALVDVLKESNASWAAQAPVLMLTVAKMTTASGRPNAHAFYDVGLAVMNLTLQATALDLYVHQMAGFYPDRARQRFAIPEGFEPVTAIAIGYLGDPEMLDEKNRERELGPRSRRPLSEFVFEGSWGEPAQIVLKAQTPS